MIVVVDFWVCDEDDDDNGWESNLVSVQGPPF